jgi:lipoprotein-releasing system permease protein
MVMEAGRIWDRALLGEPGPSSLTPAGELLKQAAYRMFLLQAKRELQAQLEPLISRPLAVQVLTWEEQRPVLIQAVEREKWIVGILVFILDVFIGCIVLLMLVLLVIEKTRDIGVLLALGAKPRGVVRIFLTDGLAIVAMGVILGLIAGHFFTDNINQIHDAILEVTGIRLFDPEIYQLDRIPITVTASEVLVSIFPPILFGFLASLIPAIWASRKDPIQTLHCE